MIAAKARIYASLTPYTLEAKLKVIREFQSGGPLVGMTDVGTNDAPAFPQADVAVAMNSGTQMARKLISMHLLIWKCSPVSGR